MGGPLRRLRSKLSRGKSGRSRADDSTPFRLLGNRRRLATPRGCLVEQKIRELKQKLLETIETLNAAVESRDPYTAGHSQRVRRIAVAVGHQLQLPEERLAGLETAAFFHDIGKIGIPDSILTKKDRLTREEQKVMEEHVTRGADIIARFPPFRPAVPAIRHHHERWDGLGYPDRLRGDEIPLEAAIVGFADAWETSRATAPTRPHCRSETHWQRSAADAARSSVRASWTPCGRSRSNVPRTSYRLPNRRQRESSSNHQLAAAGEADEQVENARSSSIRMLGVRTSSARARAYGSGMTSRPTTTPQQAKSLPAVANG
jgi:hypothetical protein